jgi:hypothetical protein
VNAAACQYAGRCEETTSLPFSGVDLWMFVMAAAVLIVLAVLIRRIPDEEEEDR